MSAAPPHSVEGARAAAADDDLLTWVQDFLASPGSDNAALGEQLADSHRWWTGPVLLPIDRLHRLAGPADHPVVVAVDEDWWRDDVEDLAEQIEEGWEPPPLVITWKAEERQLVVEDGNHRLEALRRAEANEAWAVVGFRQEDERDAWVASPASPR